ncbi:hypothetical protein RSAG8_02170, partial [Rhizoctonia solani AG-8 WAC10335]
MSEISRFTPPKSKYTTSSRK